MTAAPYPAETRAKGWRFELDHERIEQSDTWTLAAPEVRPWLLMLWMTAWKQTPCGSLTDDDALIAARIGMPLKAFSKHRPVLMRGWWKADDGRLYHDTVAQRVVDMLAKRAKDAERTANRRARLADAQTTPPVVTGESRGTPDGATREFDTKHQAPSTKHLNQAPEPSGGTTSPRTPRSSPAPSGAAAPGKPEPPTNATWEAYSVAYATRYGEPPVRNQVVNGLLKQVINRLGGDEAPAVAAFYVRSQNRLYVSAGHALNLLVRDAEKLRTEWATGRQGTAAQAIQADKTQANFNAFAPLLAEAKETAHAQP